MGNPRVTVDVDYWYDIALEEEARFKATVKKSAGEMRLGVEDVPLDELVPLLPSARKDCDVGLTHRPVMKVEAMKERASGFGLELRISPKTVLVTLALLAWMPAIAGQFLPGRLWHIEARLIALALIMWAMAAFGWLLTMWNPCVGRWFTLLAATTTPCLSYAWTGVAEFLILMVLPVALAAALVSTRAAAATAAGETALVLLMAGAGTRPALLIAVTATIWATLGAMYATCQSVDHIARWSWWHYQEAQSVMAKARDRKSELEQALDDLAHANRQLALANERTAALRAIAEEAHKAKAEFVAKVSHEFRTPLNMIVGLVGLMVDSADVYGENLPPTVVEDLRIVRRNCDHLSSLVNDVLALSQAEAGRLSLHRERVDLAEVIDGTLSVVRPLVEKKGLSLQVIVPDDLPDVYCDRVRIRQVILNLASNAARFTEKGSITIGVAQEDDRIVISVADTGPGVAPEDTERIFEPFCQGAGNGSRDKGGCGLGLSVSKEFVELHGGRIWLQTEQGVGSTFSFDLPVSAPMDHIARPGHQIMEEWTWKQRQSRASFPDSHYRPRVIICDETGDLHPAFARCSDEVEFVGVKTLDQVTEMLRQCPAHAVLLNAASPDDLWTLVEQARTSIRDTPVIACSVPTQIARALDAGACGYLIKPVVRADLESAIQSLEKRVRRILVVDDDPDVLRLFTRMLHVCDSTLEVVTASSGQEALEMLRSALPDVMLLDIIMPDMSGWQVLAIKDQDDTIRDVPVVLVSARDPTDQPSASQALLATMGEGISLSKLFRCSLEISMLLNLPDQSLDLAPV